MSDVCLKLTEDEIDRYAPYHMWTEFTEGYDDYMLGNYNLRAPTRPGDKPSLFAEVGQQAYDRGMELAMRRKRRQDALNRAVFNIMK